VEERGKRVGKISKFEKWIFVVFPTPTFGKRTDHPPGKSVTFFELAFSFRRDGEHIFKFYIHKGAHLLYRMV
jgi:hypothetical protein